MSFNNLLHIKFVTASHQRPKPCVILIVAWLSLLYSTWTSLAPVNFGGLSILDMSILLTIAACVLSCILYGTVYIQAFSNRWHHFIFITFTASGLSGASLALIRLIGIPSNEEIGAFGNWPLESIVITMAIIYSLLIAAGAVAKITQIRMRRIQKI